MANRVISDLTRTMKSFFRLGALRLKDSSGILYVRNGDDSANADTAAARFRILGTNASNAVVLNAPSSLSATVTYTLPSSNGSTGAVLTENGSGDLSWTEVAANADNTQTEAFSDTTSSPLTICTPPANAVITRVVVEVTSAASGGSPQIEIGTATTSDKYMASSENDLTSAALYVVQPFESAGGSPEAIIATITADSQTFSGNIYVTYTVAG